MDKTFSLYEANLISIPSNSYGPPNATRGRGGPQTQNTAHCSIYPKSLPTHTKEKKKKRTLKGLLWNKVRTCYLSRTGEETTPLDLTDPGFILELCSLSIDAIILFQ